MNKMTHKTNKPNIIPIKKTKVRSQAVPDSKWVADYTHFLTRQRSPMTDAGLNRFVEGFVAWALKDETALRVTDYPISVGIPEQTYYDWKERFPIIAEAHADVMSVIASRRERGALTRTLSESAVYRRQQQYEKSAEEAARFHASLKAEADKNAATNSRFVVNEVSLELIDFGSSDIVPPRKALKKDEQESI